MNKKILGVISGISGFLLFALPAFAHVIVQPSRVGVAAFQTFTVGVPNEKDSPTTELRLTIPNGLKSVSPNVKPGWTIDVKKTGSGDDATVSEIDWTGGSIPPGERDDFLFNAQVPASPTTLGWKAYQTYEDGTVVSWDVDPAKLKNLSDAQQDELVDKQNKGEYSTTQVINDLAGSDGNAQTTSSTTGSSKDNFSDWLSVIAILISAGALYLSWSKAKS